MSQSDQKIVQYMNEAHASESGMIRVLQAQIAITPSGAFRNLLKKHLSETEGHAARLRGRIEEIDGGHGFQAVAVGIGMVQSALGQVLAIGKTPFDLLRGAGGEEKLLKCAKDDCAAEALEIATYTALGRLADVAGDERTAKLAASILAEEEHMLERLLKEIPRLTQAVAEAAFKGESRYDITDTGAADTVESAAGTVKETVEDGVQAAKRTARQARKIPGVAVVEGEVKGALAEEGDLAIAGYDDLTAVDVNQRLSGLSQIDIAKIDAYERAHQNRSTILNRVAALRGNEPWPGYDEQTVDQVEEVLAKIDDPAKLKAVRSYEVGHKNRSTVIRATERELAQAAG